MSSEGQVPLSLLGHLPIPRTNDTGRRGSLGSGIIGGLLQFASPKFASPMSSMVNGFSAEYESIPDIHRTGNESAAKIHKLRNGPHKIILFSPFWFSWGKFRQYFYIFIGCVFSTFSEIVSIWVITMLAREKRSSAFSVWALPLLYDNPSEQSVIAFGLSLSFAAHATPSSFSNLAARSARHRKTASQRITAMELPLDSFDSFRQGLLDPGPDTHHFSFIHNKSFSRQFKIACNSFIVILPVASLHRIKMWLFKWKLLKFSINMILENSK